MIPIRKPKTFKEYSQPELTKWQARIVSDILAAAAIIHQHALRGPENDIIQFGIHVHQQLEQHLDWSAGVEANGHNINMRYFAGIDPFTEMLGDGVDPVNLNTDEIGERRPY